MRKKMKLTRNFLFVIAFALAISVSGLGIDFVVQQSAGECVISDKVYANEESGLSDGIEKPDYEKENEDVVVENEPESIKDGVKLNPTFVPKSVDPDQITKYKMSDVNKKYWYYDSVNYVLFNGLMNGMKENVFSPDEETTRAMVITVLARMNDVEPVTGPTWFVPCVKWGVRNEITDGKNPGGDITRQEIVTMLYRYAKLINKDAEGNVEAPEFTDKNKISSWAQESVSWACSVGVINGMKDVKTKALVFYPQKTATRAEVATILTKFCENVLK